MFAIRLPYQIDKIHLSEFLRVILEVDHLPPGRLQHRPELHNPFDRLTVWCVLLGEFRCLGRADRWALPLSASVEMRGIEPRSNYGFIVLLQA